MSKTAIIVLVLIALGLGGSLFLMNRSGPATPSGTGSDATALTGPAFELDPAQVRALSVAGPDGNPKTVQRTGSGAWVYTVGSASEAQEIGWPVDATQVNTALRGLALIPAAGSAQGATLGSNTSTIRISFADGSIRTIRAERESIGGNTLVQVDSESAVLIRADVLQPLLTEGPDNWRVRGPLAGLTTDVSRITLSAGDQRVSLARVDNRWIMRAPISAPADEVAIRSLLDGILKMRIARFESLPRDPDSPVLIISVERDDTVQADGSVRQVTARELTLGSAADPTTGSRFAALRGSGLPGATSLLLERGDFVTDQQLASLARPEQFISKLAAPERAGDIGIVILRPLGDAGADRGFRRDIEGWNEMRPDGGMRTAELPDRESLEEIMRLMTSVLGQPRIAASIDDFRALTRIELFTLDDRDLGTIQAGYAQGGILALRRGNVLWLYPEATPPRLLALPAPDAVEPAPQREPSAAGDDDTDDRK